MLRARVSVPLTMHAVTGGPSTLYALAASLLVAVVLGMGVQSEAKASSQAVSPIPVGMIVPYAGSEAAIPPGWLPADGRELSRSAYAALFASFGTSFGSGDGSATFDLPDLRGRFPLGLSESGTGSVLGGTGGTLAHGVEQITLPAHDHDFVVPDHTHAVKPLATHGHTWTGSLHQGHWEWPDWAIAHNSGTLAPTCEPGCADGWTSVTGGGQTVRSSPAAAQAAVGGVDAPYQAVGYLVKISETTAVPCGAIWGYGGADAPEGSAAANGAPASGGVAGCLDAGFGGQLPDLRQRFALGASATRTPGTGGGDISHAHGVTVGNHTHTATLEDRTHVLIEPDHVHGVSYGGQNFDYERYEPFSSILAGVAEVSGSPSTVGTAHTSTPAGGGTLTTAPTGAQTLTSSPENPPFLTANFVVPDTAGDPTAGSIGAYGGSQAPAGWLVADGTCVPTTRYPALFNAIGHAYGGSGGSFCLPDLRQRFLLGKSATGTGSELGAVGGAIDHVHTATVAGDRPTVQVPAHEHAWTFPAHVHGVEGVYSENAGANAPGGDWQAQIHNGTLFTSSTAGAQSVRSAPSAPQNVMASELSPARTLTTTPANPPYTVVNFLIATGDDGSAPPPPEEPPSTSAFPVGLVVPFAGSDSAVPNGWLPADGRQLSRAAYGDLFSAIGTAYGSGDGSSTFAVPDLRGRFGLGLAGAGTGSSLGATGGTFDHGAATVTLPGHTHDFAIPAHNHSVDKLASHSHTWSGGLRNGHWEWPGPVVLYNSGWLDVQCAPGCNDGWATVGGGASSATTAAVSVQANVEAANPPYQVVRFLIKTQESAPAPCGAIWGYGGASAPGGTQLARGGSADAGRLGGCLDASFAGNLPDLRGRFPLGQAAAGPASSLAATGGALGHTHRVTTGDHAHAASVPNHAHTLNEPDHVHSVGNGQTQYDPERYDPFEWIMASPMATSSGSTTAGQPRASTAAGGGSFTTSAGGAQTLDTSAADPPYVTVNYALYKTEAYVPDAGILAPFAGPVAPDGWVIADGRCLPTAGRFAKLFNAIGYAYGGSGNSFCVPDLRQRFPLGKTSSGTSSALGAQGGAVDHVHTATVPGHRPSLQIPAHSHTWAFPNHQHWIHGSGAASAGSNGGQPQVWWGSYQSSATGGQTVTSTASTPASVQATGNSPGQNLTTATQNPPFQVLNYVIATGVTGDELRADTVHSNGADLDWLRHAGPSSSPFAEYEVHRSANPAFTPSASTLLATIRDASVTSYRDTTAAPAQVFTYLVLTNGAPSNRVTVTLPQDGKARKLLQPGPGAGQATYVSGPGAGNACANHGAEARLLVHSAGAAKRALLRFDLRDVPAEATIEQATLSLRRTVSPAAAATVELHRATAAWDPGTGIDECTGDGATWLDAASGVQWQAPGGDFDAAAADALAIAAGAPLGWDDFDLTTLVQRWTSGETPNLGVVAKLAAEDPGSPVGVEYYADDGTQWVDLRPKLAIDYVDGSHTLGPEVTVSSPAPGSTVSGSVTLVADAADDRRVESVEFLLDGSPLGAPDTSEPFEVTWDSRSVANGGRTLVVRATDDAGNVGSSPTVMFTVANSDPPTAAVTSAAAQAGAPPPNTPPSATASASPTTGDAPLTVAFTGAGTDDDGTIASYAWDLDGDGEYDDSTAQNPSSQYTSAGFHYARLRVTDDDGAHGFATPVTVHVSTPAPPAVPPQVVGFTQGAQSNPASGSWQLPAGWQPGDMLIVWWYARRGSKTISESTAITQKVDANLGTSSYGRLFVGYRHLQAGDTNPSWTSSSSSSATTVWGAIAVSGASSSGDPFEAASNVLGRLNLASPNPPSVTTLTDAGLVLTLVGKNNDASTSAAPTGYSKQGFASSTSGDDASGGAATIVKPTAGVEDPSNWALSGTSSDDSLTWTAAIAPSGATSGNGANQSPTAAASASPTTGDAPLDVTFDGASSNDPDGSLAAYAWDLDGDGQYDDATGAQPSRQYAAGLYRAWLRVTDDEGAHGFSGPITITAGGAAPPGGLWDVTASASDDVGVAKVEFFADDLLIGTDTTAPYSIVWDTLGTQRPFYDGSHTLTVRAYDGHAQSTLSQPIAVAVDNTGGTPYRATYETSAIPNQIVYDPASPQPVPVDVTVTNESGSTWTGMRVHYRWVLRGQTQDGPPILLGADVLPGGQRTVRVDVPPPTLPEGTARDQYTLRLDLRDAAGTWFADRGNAPHETPVTVANALEIGAGLERYYHYEGEDLGAGMQHVVNVASGNSILRWTPAEAPGRGLATVVDLTYNSLEGGTGSPVGNGFSLSISSLTRFGTPLDVHPLYVDLTDGDGTLHRFTSTDGTTWTAPEGVHIHLRRDGAGWAATRPDGVTFRFDADGNPTFVEDRNGNRITFELEPAPAGGKRVAAVTDAGGRSFGLVYDEAGLLQRLTDHDGSAFDFEYGATGNLLRIIQRGGTNADGSHLPDRTFTFVWAAGADGRMRVERFRDPRGSETELTYLPNGKLGSRTNRADEVTTFEYDAATRVTTVTEALARVSRYAFDVEGKVTRITNPLQQNIDVEWTPGRHVKKVIQPGGAFTEFAYDVNGYLTDAWDEMRNRTSLEYEYPQPYLSQLVRKTDPKGTATPAPGDYEWLFDYDDRGNVTSVTDPLGFASRSTYNADGTLATATDANDHVTTYVAYDANGLLTDLRDAKGQVTRFGYDPDGLLRWIQDPLHASYSGGDAYTYRTSFYYDSFGRLGRQSTPKSTVHAPRELIWTDVEYDANDNVVAEVAPYYGWDATRSGPVSRTTYDAMDRVVLETGPDTSVDPLGERVQHVYDEAGRLLKSIGPKGLLTPTIPDDYATILTYDALDRVTRETEHDVAPDGTVRSTLHTHYCYDAVGDLRRVTAPRSGLSSVDCAAAPPPFTSLLAYDDAHQLVRETDPLGHEQTAVYDANGDVVESTDENGARTTYEFDQRGQLIESREPFEDGRVLTTRTEYDPVGNVKREISPRAWDTSSDKVSFTEFVSSYQYDELDRLVREDLPTGAGTPATFVHYAYDAGGNLTWKSLPVAVSDAGDVGEGSRSTFAYWDTGSIRTSKNPATARVHFDYTALGQQSFRAPENTAGDVDPERTMLWTYYDDGLTKEQKDLAGQVTSYTYDANGNTLQTAEASGLTSAGQPPLTVAAAYDGLDRATEVRLQRAGDPKSVVTTFAYDPHGNVLEQVSNREDGAGGSVIKPGRRETFTYDGRDLPSVQVDFGIDTGTVDDARVTNLYWPTAQDRQRTIERGGTSGWTLDQTMDWAYYANGLLETQTTKNTSGSVLESHALSYTTPGGVYMNGHKTRDTFMLKGPDASAPCSSTTCTATYEYDAAERLVRSEDGHGGVTAIVLDAAGNVTGEAVTTAGTTTTTTRTYVAQQLRTSTKGSEVRRYFYTSEGNLSCVTDGTGSETDCLVPTGTDPPASVVEAYAYDYRNRMASFRRFAAGQQTDTSSYVYDPLDRVVEQVETHVDELEPRKTTLAYIGDSDVISGESIASGTGPATEKSYNYDSFGERIGLTHTAPGQPTERFSYGHDTYGSVSLLVKQSGGAQASYGYKAYGDADSALTKGDASTKNPLNAYRYSDKRLDSGSGTIDMGARRFSPDIGRFLQIDQYTDALEDLDLSMDPLTANRYALVGANPISFIEVDGHWGWNPIKEAKKRVSGAASAVKKGASAAASGIKKGVGYCLGRGAATCATVAAGVALTLTVVGAPAGGTLAGAAIAANVAARGMGAYAATRGAHGAAKRGDYKGAALSLATMGRARVPASGRVVGATAARSGDAATKKALQAQGRSGRQARLREVARDPKASSADRGWIRQEMNAIARGKRSSIRNPPGKDLAHRRGQEARKGHSYAQSDLQDRATHKTQHRIERRAR